MTDVPLDYTEFLKESNAIEGVFDADSLEQAANAWYYLLAQKKIDLSVIKQTHKILMRDQPLPTYEKGNLRKVTVYIGGRQAMPSHELKEALLMWSFRMNKVWPGRVDLETVSKELHVEYEKIHPFTDGNGRTGRMFMNWFRLKHGLPLLIIHTGEEQYDYYGWFR